MSNLCDALCKSLDCKACCENYDNLMEGCNKTARSIVEISFATCCARLFRVLWKRFRGRYVNISAAKTHFNVRQAVSESIINSIFPSIFHV
jgi:hypothetical protein